MPINPKIAPELATPAQIPTALLRSDFGNAAVKSDNVAGMMNAAPAPATARAMMICVGLSRDHRRNGGEREDGQTDEQAPRRPYRSPSAPAGNSRQANTSV